MKYQHLLGSAQREKWAGYATLVLGFYLLYGAYDRRGHSKPRFMGPFLPW